MVLWKSCPVFKYMSNLHDCYWPFEIFISGLQIVECPILVPVFFFSCLPLLLLNPTASRELDWSGANFTLHSIYTNPVPGCSFSPPLPLYLNFCRTHKHLQTHWLYNSHIRHVNSRGTPFHTGRQTTSQRSDTLIPSSLRTCRGAAPFHQRPPIPVHCMSQSPVMYVLMNVFPFNSGMKMLLKEMPSLIPNMPVALPSLGYSLSHSFTFIYSS